MVMPGSCSAAFAVFRQIEPIIVLEQLGSTLFDTALQMVVKDRCANVTDPDHPSEEGQQRAITDFYMTYNLIIKLTSVIPALLLARLGDRGWRRAPIVVPLSGYLLSRCALLLVVVFGLPLKVMLAAAVVFGLSGGFSAYWPGIMTLASLGSTAADRSKVMMRVELLYGLTGLVGSLVSGHLFQLHSFSLGNGTILLCVSTLLHFLCLVFSGVLLQVRRGNSEDSEESYHLLSHASRNTRLVEAFAGMNVVNLVLLFAAAFLYDFAVGGAIEILGSFVLKSPLSWTAAQVGYGNAAGCMIFITSFVGVIVFRRCDVCDETMILIGMLSFASGIYLMSFVTTTSMFYIARSLNLFALIPMPTIRSLVSQQVPASSCGTTLTVLQMVLKLAGVAYIPTFTKIYQNTLNSLPGLVFLVSSIFTVLAMIPISIVGCRSAQKQQYVRILGD
ncbi:thymic stromal cotransporter homolog [Fundulus heteroclitus]|uniref:thymic stromal cotransporter homolog n=1 Tax=Fundulus heteroclitus TaxID=8078 RepID=UPI00165BD1FF|nr:thymic stromal cotransporter homolog [Fundulus heteroclitus]XP_035996016.1 thymic stromal cotransporter homolog [Fundulus heteroclitus]